MRGDWIELCFVFGEVYLVSWCCGGLVVCVLGHGIFHGNIVVCCGGWWCVGVLSYLGGCAKSVSCVVVCCALVIGVCVGGGV